MERLPSGHIRNFKPRAHGLLSTLAFSADGKRLFSCSLGKSGATHIFEWNLQDRVVKRTYRGFHGWSKGIVNFDAIKNKYSVAGDSTLIKFWDMNNSDLLMTSDATPVICCNREGTLLAVSANDNNVIILAIFVNDIGAITASGTLTKGVDKNDPDRDIGYSTCQFLPSDPRSYIHYDIEWVNNSLV